MVLWPHIEESPDDPYYYGAQMHLMWNGFVAWRTLTSGLMLVLLLACVGVIPLYWAPVTAVGLLYIGLRAVLAGARERRLPTDLSTHSRVTNPLVPGETVVRATREHPIAILVRFLTPLWLGIMLLVVVSTWAWLGADWYLYGALALTGREDSRLLRPTLPVRAVLLPGLMSFEARCRNNESDMVYFFA